MIIVIRRRHVYVVGEVSPALEMIASNGGKMFIEWFDNVFE
jgi:hypothetical protein